MTPFSIESFLEIAALLSSGLFTGAAFYLTVVEHPARMSQGTSLAWVAEGEIRNYLGWLSTPQCEGTFGFDPSDIARFV